MASRSRASDALDSINYPANKSGVNRRTMLARWPDKVFIGQICGWVAGQFQCGPSEGDGPGAFDSDCLAREIDVFCVLLGMVDGGHDDDFDRVLIVFLVGFLGVMERLCRYLMVFKTEIL